MKKRLVSFLAVTVLMSSLVMTGCGAATSEADQLENIKKSGKLVIAMEGQWAPWTYHDESGALVGYDTEVGMAIAEKLGVEAEFVEGEWDGLFVGLDNGTYDMIINGVDVTEERSKKYDFTTPYAYDHTVIIVPEDNADITSFEDLSGKKTTNSLGSTYADMAASFGAEVANVDTLSETIDMIIAGRADATLNAETSYYDYMSQHPDAKIKIAAVTDEANQIAIPLRKEGSAALKEAVDNAIEELRAEGKLAELSMKYFGGDIS